jgi:hypothetical protein
MDGGWQLEAAGCVHFAFVRTTRGLYVNDNRTVSRDRHFLLMSDQNDPIWSKRLKRNISEPFVVRKRKFNYFFILLFVRPKNEG